MTDPSCRAGFLRTLSRAVGLPVYRVDALWQDCVHIEFGYLWRQPLVALSEHECAVPCPTARVEVDLVQGDWEISFPGRVFRSANHAEGNLRGLLMRLMGNRLLSFDLAPGNALSLHFRVGCRLCLHPKGGDWLEVAENRRWPARYHHFSLVETFLSTEHLES